MTETKIHPQSIMLKVATTELTPSFIGMLHLDSNNILRVDSVGAGVPIDFVTVLPEHTTAGNHGPKVTITQTVADNALVIAKSGLGAAVAITCLNTGTGRALDIISSSNTDPAIYVTKSGNAAGMIISKSGTSYAEGLAVTQSGVGCGIRIYQQTAYDGLRVEKSAGGAGSPLMVFNSGSDPALNIEQRVGGIGINVAASSAATAACINISNNGSGPAFIINQNKDNIALDINKTTTGTQHVVDVSNKGGPNSFALNILQSGDGKALRVEKNGTDNADAIAFVNSSGSGDVVEVWQFGNGNGINIKKVGVGIGDALLIENTGIGAGVTVTHLGASVAVQDPQIEGSAVVINRNASGRGHALIVLQQQTASINSATIIFNYGANHALHVMQTRSGNNAAAIRIDNISNGKDIEGTNVNWWIDKNGNGSMVGSLGIGDSLQVNENTTLCTSGGYFCQGVGPDLYVNQAGGYQNDGWIVCTHPIHRINCHGTGLRWIWWGSRGATPPIGTHVMLTGVTGQTMFARVDGTGSNQVHDQNVFWGGFLHYVWMGDKWHGLFS